MPFPLDLSPETLLLANELQIRPEDIEETFSRSSGPGGQNVNKRSTAIRLRHLPTGIDVHMQKHREQHLNRLSAWKLLILKIEEQVKGERSKLQQEIFKIRKQKQRRSRKAKEKMLQDKHHHATIKERRQQAWRESI